MFHDPVPWAEAPQLNPTCRYPTKSKNPSNTTRTAFLISFLRSFSNALRINIENTILSSNLNFLLPLPKQRAN